MACVVNCYLERVPGIASRYNLMLSFEGWHKFCSRSVHTLDVATFHICHSIWWSRMLSSYIVGTVLILVDRFLHPRESEFEYMEVLLP